MVWIMLAITMVCVVIVFAIVMAQKEKGALVKQAKAVTKDMVYENAYIVSNDDGRLIFICDGDLYRAKGTMEENFTGVCDIEISGSKVKKIQIKPDDISGVMLSYGDGTMQIAGQGDIPMQSSELPVYDETGTSPKEISVSDLIIGSETLSYILDSGRICAIVRSVQLVNHNNFSSYFLTLIPFVFIPIWILLNMAFRFSYTSLYFFCYLTDLFYCDHKHPVISKIIMK